MMSTFVTSFLGGIVIGLATMALMIKLTKQMESKVRLRLLMWVGIPLGGLMAVLATTVIPALINNRM